jgi:hypothetical protein
MTGAHELLARIRRAIEALEDGDYELAIQVLLDLVRELEEDA